MATLNEAVEFTEERAEDPAFGQVVDQMNPAARQGHGQVGHCQVRQIIIGGRVHSFAPYDGADDQGVAHECDRDQDQVEENLDGCFQQWNVLDGVRIDDMSHVK